MARLLIIDITPLLRYAASRAHITGENDSSTRTQRDFNSHHDATCLLIAAARCRLSVCVYTFARFSPGFTRY